MRIAGIRGAVQVESNSEKLIHASTIELVNQIIDENKIKIHNIACIIFTMTKDLNADFPAYAVRQMKNEFENVPLICGQEIDVPKSMKRVIRILMLINSNLKQSKIKHQYLGATKVLRKDITKK